MVSQDPSGSNPRINMDTPPGKRGTPSANSKGKALVMACAALCLLAVGVGIGWMIRDSAGTRSMSPVATPAMTPRPGPASTPAPAPAALPVSNPAPPPPPPPPPAPVPTPTGVIKDPALDTALRKLLSLPLDHPIQAADLLRLNTLDVANRNISSLAGLEQTVNIEVLNVSGNPISDADLDVIAKFPLMYNLIITECPRITDAGMLRLGGLHRVHILWLSYLKIQGPGLQIVRNMRELKQLYINFTQVTDEWIAPVAELPELDILMIRGASHLTDAALRSLSASRSIRHLSAGEIQGITDAGIAELGRMRQLQSLELYRLDNVTANGYRLLKACPMLEELQIGGSQQVTDDVIVALAEFPALRVLQIQGRTSLTPASFHHVARLSRLKLLLLPAGTCAPGELEQLQKAMPACTIKEVPPQYTWPHILEPGIKTW